MSLAGQCKGYFALGQHLSLHRIDGPGMRLRRRVPAQHIIDTPTRERSPRPFSSDLPAVRPPPLALSRTCNDCPFEQ